MSQLIALPELLQRRRIGADTVDFDVADDWLQGRTCYGGLISMLGVVAMRDLAGHAFSAEASLRGLQTCFIAPVSPGQVEVGVQLLRQGRNVCQVQAQARQGGQVAAVLIGVFGAERPSSLRPQRPQRPAPSRAAADLPAPPPGFGPAFMNHFDSCAGPAPTARSAGRSSRVRSTPARPMAGGAPTTSRRWSTAATSTTARCCGRPAASSPLTAARWWRCSADSHPA